MNSRNSLRTTFAFLLLAALAGCSGDAQSAGPSGPRVVPVKLAPATLRQVAESTEYLATLQSRQAAMIRPDVEGQITAILVQSGATVEPGTPLLQIDPSKQQATVNSQEATLRSRQAALELNRIDLERTKKLFDAGVVSRQALDQAQSTFDATKADVAALEASSREQQVQLHYYLVRAPAAGVIGDIPVRVGDRVTTSTVLTTLDQSRELEAYVSVPAEKSAQIRMGMPMELLNDSGEVALRTQVSFVSPRMDPENQLLLLKANVPNQNHRFRNDQMVHARLIWKEQKMPTIPVTAVTRLGGQVFAYVAEQQDGKLVARQRAIEVGDVVGNDYVILQGIRPGEQIITSGTQTLADGAPVAPQS
jgi:RND family efflux transporter MFP subunit